MFLKGKALNSAALTTMKIALLAPIPKASMLTTANSNLEEVTRSMEQELLDAAGTNYSDRSNVI